MDPLAEMQSMTAPADADLEVLRSQGFEDEDIWDIASIASFFAMSNRLANFTGMRPNDEFYAMARTFD